MKKANFIASLLTAVACAASAQDTSAPNLAKMNSDVKNPYVKIEVLDKMQQELKYFDLHPVQSTDQKLLLYDTYRSMANGYSVNNHFKQGYAVYQKYIVLKEKIVSLEKTEAIAQLAREMDTQQSKDENEMISQKNENQQLQSDNKLLEKKRKGFRQFFSFGVIALTVLFSFLLLQAGMKMNKIRHDLKAGRERLKTIHRVSSFGRLKKGIVFLFNNSFSNIKTLIEVSISTSEKLPPSVNKKNDELNGMKKLLADLKNKI